MITRILAFVCLLSILAGTGILYWGLHQRALVLAERHARALLAAADNLAVYTREHVSPLAEKLQSAPFNPETEPSFAAARVFRVAGETSYSYRTPALNPTNPEDLPSPTETELIRHFREHGQHTERTGVRDMDQERLFYIAHPIRVTSEKCLTCHGSADTAPPALVARYGSSNGFGWKLDEVVGIELLTVPVTSQFQNVLQFTLISAGSIALMFVFCYVALSASLQFAVVRPLQDLARAADQASKSTQGDFRQPAGGVQEIGQVAAAIDRLRVSLAKALANLSRGPERRDAS
jgi:protein-histidine pros-kinase